MATTALRPSRSLLRWHSTSCPFIITPSRSISTQSNTTRSLRPLQPLGSPLQLQARSLLPPTSRRRCYTVPSLVHSEHYRQHGITKGDKVLYSGQGFLLAWDAYQNHLINRLNELTAGTQFEDKTPLDILVMTSRQAEHAAVFNYASTAHNNHFFFEGLTPAGDQRAISQLLEEGIRGTFSSVEELKTTFLTTAEMVFSNAFVWLVLDKSRLVRILVTYNSGTPYTDAHRRQSYDTNTTAPGTGDVSAIGDLLLSMRDRNRTQGEREENKDLVPLLCVNVWEHAYLLDHGIGGKAKYLDSWWDMIDWNVVARRFPGVGTRGNKMY